MGLIYFLSDQPDLSTGFGIWDLIGRKFAHMLIFGLLAAAWYRAFNARLAPAIFISMLYAVSDEFHQSFVQGRNGSPIDVVIDLVGIVTVSYLIVRLSNKRGRRS